MQPPMTSGELARRLNVSRDTVRNYARDFSEFLSNEATGAGMPNAKRRYSWDDARTLATVANLRAKGLNVEQIRAALRDGERLDTVPDAPTPAEQEARSRVQLVPLSEYQRIADVLRVREVELDRLREERDSALERWQGDVTQLNARIADLQHEIGVLQGQLSERLPPQRMMQIILLVAAFMVIVVIVLALSGRVGR